MTPDYHQIHSKTTKISFFQLSQLLHQLIFAENQIPWEFIHGLMQMVFYGNRINKIHDNNVLMAYVKENFNLKVINGKVMELKNKIKIPVSSRLQVLI